MMHLVFPLLIRWIALYPVDRALRHLNNLDQMCFRSIRSIAPLGLVTWSVWLTRLVTWSRGWWPDLGWQIINLIWCKGLLTFFGFTNLHFSPFIESSDEEDNVENIHKRGEDFSVLLEKSGKDAVVLVHSIPSSLYRWNKVKPVGLFYKR